MRTSRATRKARGAVGKRDLHNGTDATGLAECLDRFGQPSFHSAGVMERTVAAGFGSAVRGLTGAPVGEPEGFGTWRGRPIGSRAT